MLILKKILYFALILFLFAEITSCSNNEEDHDNKTASQHLSIRQQSKETKPATTNDAPKNRIFQSISPAEAMRMLHGRDDILFLDVRTLRERSRVMIPDSQYFPITSIFKGNINLPTDKAILLVCSVGGRSYAAGKLLSAKGYYEVYNLSGGIRAWYKAGLPVIAGTKDSPSVR